MAKYHHLSLYEREVLYAQKLQGLSFREIARGLDRSHSSLVREYYRNLHYHKKEYVACVADKKAKRRAVKQRYKAPLKNPLIFVYVRERLRKYWSPELIAGRLSVDYPEESIHHETIYRYIYNTKKTRGMKLWRYLRYHRKRRMKKVCGRKVKPSPVKDVVRIDQRPEVIETRKTIGHWETDLMGGKIRDKQAVSATVERKTRYSVLSLLEGKGARFKTKATIDRLSTLPPEVIKSLTTDNGAENARHQEISSMLSIPVYFCFPYHSWEKGSVENMIQRMRQFIPKGTSADKLNKKYINALEYKLNNTPRKCLNYLTPTEAMKNEFDKLKINCGALRLRM